MKTRAKKPWYQQINWSLAVLYAAILGAAVTGAILLLRRVLG